VSQIAPSAADLADRLASWREAWQIRRAHPKWAVLWVAPAHQYQAFRLSRRHRDAILTAATPQHKPRRPSGHDKRKGTLIHKG
jgi:hypothetical protein